MHTQYTDVILSVPYIYNQQNITSLYLPYLATSSFNCRGGVENVTASPWFSVINCNNLSDIYIYRFIIGGYDGVWSKSSAMFLYVSSFINTGVFTLPETNVHIADGISNVFINDPKIRSFYYSYDISSSNKGQNQMIYHNKINMFIYNKRLVNLNYASHKVYNELNNLFLLDFILHVPHDLLEDYNKAYSNYDKIGSIVGDIV